MKIELRKFKFILKERFSNLNFIKCIRITLERLKSSAARILFSVNFLTKILHNENLLT